MLQSPKVLFSTLALHKHAQNIALALNEAGWLGLWQTRGLDYFPGILAKSARSIAGKCWPRVNVLLNSRQVAVELLHAPIDNGLRMEFTRLLCRKVKSLRLLEDWLWEKSEKSLDQIAARRILSEGFTTIIGTEFGSLESIIAARKSGKLSVVLFTSPHHTVYKSTVEPELERFPSLVTKTQRVLLQKAIGRNARRDEEAHQADFIHTNSSFVKRSLIQAGIAGHKIEYASLGCPPAISRSVVENNVKEQKSKIKFVFAGGVGMHKGAHILLEAWKKVDTKQAELHFYGKVLLPDAIVASAPPSVTFHGVVPSDTLFNAFRKSHLMVFPTLFDGFGQVVAEALANGCPVLTTSNAGASDLIRNFENGWIVNTGCIDSLAQRLAWCLDNPKELELMRFASIQTAKDHTWFDFREKFISDFAIWHRSRFQANIT